MSSVYLLWDESHFWGLLMWRALDAWGLKPRLVRAAEVAGGLLASRPPAALVVPGGNARRKAACLGPAGLEEIRRFVRGGGAYVGACGGAGLGLSGSGGLGLCPWSRRPFENRLEHFASGHVRVALDPDHPLTPDGQERMLVPVWWPGQFREGGGDGVRVLARYQAPGPDFWMADLPCSSLTEEALADWENLYGVRLSPSFLSGRPCVVSGKYGQGTYVETYAHLETPASPQANAWLSHILNRLMRLHEDFRSPLPAWDLGGLPDLRGDPALSEARRLMSEAVALGVEHFLLFWRNPWLIGWRRGIPGAAINSLHCLLCQITAREETESSREFWAAHRERFEELVPLFHKGFTGYLLAERLAMTVFHSEPETVFPQALREQREALFGLPMGPGGMFGELLGILDELAFRTLADETV